MTISRPKFIRLLVLCAIASLGLALTCDALRTTTLFYGLIVFASYFVVASFGILCYMIWKHSQKPISITEV